MGGENKNCSSPNETSSMGQSGGDIAGAVGGILMGAAATKPPVRYVVPALPIVNKLKKMKIAEFSTDYVTNDSNRLVNSQLAHH